MGFLKSQILFQIFLRYLNPFKRVQVKKPRLAYTILAQSLLVNSDEVDIVNPTCDFLLVLFLFQFIFFQVLRRTDRLSGHSHTSLLILLSSHSFHSFSIWFKKLCQAWHFVRPILNHRLRLQTVEPPWIITRNCLYRQQNAVFLEARSRLETKEGHIWI